MSIQIKTPEANVAVIVGRFQTPFLTEGHTALLNWITQNHKRVIVFLGVAPAKVSRNNPLDFEARKQMILEKYPDTTILYIKDVRDDVIWSKALDGCISDILNPHDKAMLYGSRDSFIAHYKGRYHTTELESEKIASATEIREQIAHFVVKSKEFRSGVVWAAFNQYPVAYPTVDFTVINKEKNQMLLGRKPNETLFRFGGGFVDITDQSLELAAARELGEEFGLIGVGIPEFICSAKVDDWRYKNSGNGIITSFFVFEYIYGHPEASDDIAEVKWFDINKIELEMLVKEHRHLLSTLLAKKYQITK